MGVYKRQEESKEKRRLFSARLTETMAASLERYALENRLTGALAITQLIEAGLKQQEARQKSRNTKAELGKKGLEKGV